MSTYFFQILPNYTTIRDVCQDFLKNLRFHASCGRHWYNYSEVGGGLSSFFECADRFLLLGFTPLKATYRGDCLKKLPNGNFW